MDELPGYPPWNKGADVKTHSGLPPSSPTPSAPLSSPPSAPTSAPTPTPPPPQPTPPPPSAPPPSSRKAAAAASAASSSSSSKGERSESLPLLSKEKIEQIAHTVDPHLKLDPDVQEFLQQYAGELVDELAGMSARLAQARKSKVLEVQDVRFYLEHNWNIFIPGFGADPVKAKRKIPETEAHKNRQAIIKKHLKKF
ncbi:transcription initiation factor TFIID subunit 12-like [Paramacrobiotus metropolitanus]|uniref:transcription initiation factor TFIID subunit 12-like n=1 Tax=Paramacrobiotus metropolitanus TaxID=2943436 RepID=UPI0024464FDE|nr:transcription initiation factor TFIID subunit 12-like [Paramacrobiotus metropolitanus]XP_055353901.1 transcription initiation factor TFIID subunit 12-like [Paramacrobiotus metropolitanus]